MSAKPKPLPRNQYTSAEMKRVLEEISDSEHLTGWLDKILMAVGVQSQPDAMIMIRLHDLIDCAFDESRKPFSSAQPPEPFEDEHEIGIPA
jgi:hypothetical protein